MMRTGRMVAAHRFWSVSPVMRECGKNRALFGWQAEAGKQKTLFTSGFYLTNNAWVHPG